MPEPVAVGVVGVGAIGRHHARVYAQRGDAELVAVFDTDEARSRAVAAEHGCRAARSLAELLGAVEAVSVAVPTLQHYEVGAECLEHGVDVLVEKPITSSLDDADALVALAERLSRVLQVGHVERYNPAVEALLPLVRAPGFIEVHRLGSFAPRSLEVDVILDLMIHDIDVVHALSGAEIEEIRAVGVPVLSDAVDIANVRLVLAGGCVVNMTASRVSMSRVRKVRIFQPEAYFSVDYSSQDVACFRLRRNGAGRPEIQGVPVQVRGREPLANELGDFLDCIRARGRPRVDGRAGRRALATALAIRDQMRCDVASTTAQTD